MAEQAPARQRYVTPIDVLVGLGWLRPAHVEDWRRGRVPYLERVTVASLGKRADGIGEAVNPCCPYSA